MRIRFRVQDFALWCISERRDLLKLFLSQEVNLMV